MYLMYLNGAQSLLAQLQDPHISCAARMYKLNNILFPKIVRNHVFQLYTIHMLDKIVVLKYHVTLGIWG